ncbi:TIGR04206 family protein [Halopenitus sp. POP-27]|uniref:TIGR04206 family protein n=1 Tax=Halopenitus sp. POP-27 TaxID=2994425 RepID=UPI0024683830|nr:TIGR04206 family protein [Halopenitus sp. POP-27]
MTDASADRSDPRSDAPGPSVDRADRSRPRSDGPNATSAGSESRAGRRALLVIVGLLVVPVTVIVDGATYTVVSLWGLVTIVPGAGGDLAVSGYPIWRYVLAHPLPFGALPSSIQAWPVALVFHLLAAGSAAAGVVVDREDPRVTGGLLVLAGVASLSVAIGLGSRYGLAGPTVSTLVVPIATICAWACAAVLYGPPLRGLLDR